MKHSVIQTIRRALAEMSYAQKRSFELRTGVPILRPDERPRRITRFDELEFLLHSETTEPTVARVNA